MARGLVQTDAIIVFALVILLNQLDRMNSKPISLRVTLSDETDDEELTTVSKNTPKKAAVKKKLAAKKKN